MPLVSIVWSTVTLPGWPSVTTWSWSAMTTAAVISKGRRYDLCTIATFI